LLKTRQGFREFRVVFLLLLQFGTQSDDPVGPCFDSEGLSAFRIVVSLIPVKRKDDRLSSVKDRMRLAAELVSRGATMLADPCPQDGGVQVRYRGKVYCTTHNDLSSIATVNAVTYEGVKAQMKEVILTRLNETTLELSTERDLAKQEQLVALAAKYFELLQKLQQK
jgi:UPF0148 protein